MSGNLKLDGNDLRARMRQEQQQRGLVDRLMGRRTHGGGGGDIETGVATVLLSTGDHSLFRIISLLSPGAKALAVCGGFFAICQGLSSPVFGLLLSQVVSVYFDPDPRQVRRKADFWASMFLVLAFTVATVMPLKIFSLAVMGQKLVRAVRRAMFERVLRQEIAWFDSPDNTRWVRAFQELALVCVIAFTTTDTKFNLLCLCNLVDNSGAISARLSMDASLIQSLVGDLLSLLLQNLSTVAGALVIGFLANWKLTLVVFAVMPLIGVQGYVQIRRSRGFGAQAKAEYAAATQMACDAVRSIRTVASFGAEDAVAAAYAAECAPPMRAGIRQGLVAGLGLGFSQLAIYGAYALSFWYGARLVRQGDATFAQVFRVRCRGLPSPARSLLLKNSSAG